MRLTVEEHREAIKRYRHIKPARGPKGRRCSARCPGSSRTCTRERGHRGPHVAHGSLKRVLAVWDSGSRTETPGDAGRRTVARKSPPGRVAKRPLGLPTGSPTGLLEALRSLGGRLIGSADQIAFLVLMVIFVKLAIDVLMSLR